MDLQADYDVAHGYYVCGACHAKLAPVSRTWSNMLGSPVLWIAGTASILVGGIPWLSVAFLAIGLGIELTRVKLQIVAKE